MKRALFSSILLALLLFTLAFTTVHGQGVAGIALSSPDTSQFP